MKINILDQAEGIGSVLIKGHDRGVSNKKQVVFRPTKSLLERIDKARIGNRNTAMEALLKFALDELEQSNKMIVIDLGED